MLFIVTYVVLLDWLFKERIFIPSIKENLSFLKYYQSRFFKVSIGTFKTYDTIENDRVGNGLDDWSGDLD